MGNLFKDKNCLTNKNFIEDKILYDTSEFFKVFSDVTRLKILFFLLQGEMCVSHLAKALDISQSAVSHQLRGLRKSEMVNFRKVGKTAYYFLDDSHISTVLEQGVEHIKHKKNLR